MYESSFIDRLIISKGMDAAKLFHMSFRLIDDTLSIDNKYWKRYVERKYDENAADGIGGIYPADLALNDTTVEENKEVTFLGMRIYDMNSKLCVSVFDKRREFPFNVLRYPHMCSVIPSSIPYAVLVGQMYRFKRICTMWKDFAQETQQVAKLLITQGCTPNRVDAVIRKFVYGCNTYTSQWLNISSKKIIERIRRGLDADNIFEMGN